jgi:hypothetical protein
MCVSSVRYRVTIGRRAKLPSLPEEQHPVAPSCCRRSVVKDMREAQDSSFVAASNIELSVGEEISLGNLMDSRDAPNDPMTNDPTDGHWHLVRRKNAQRRRVHWKLGTKSFRH